MISKDQCDTEDWSNDAEISASITGINIFFYIYFNGKLILNFTVLLFLIAFFLIT